jgi:hypothetical protein
MKQKIVDENEQSLDDLIKRARSDSQLKRIIRGKPEKKQPEQQGYELVIAVDDEILGMREFEPRGVMEKRKGKITCFAIHGNKLLDAVEGHGIYNTLAATYLKRDPVLLYDTNFFDQIYSFNGYLFASGVKKGGVYEVLVVGDRLNRIIMSCPAQVVEMCEYKGKLVHADCLGRIYNTEHEEVIMQNVADDIKAICNNNDILYAATGNRVLDATNAKTAARRDSQVKCLCVHRERLLDGGAYGIYDTLRNEKIISANPDKMISVPSRWMEQYRDDNLPF